MCDVEFDAIALPCHHQVRLWATVVLSGQLDTVGAGTTS